jgi:hypothetical protein
MRHRIPARIVRAGIVFRKYISAVTFYALGSAEDSQALADSDASVAEMKKLTS